MPQAPWDLTFTIDIPAPLTAEARIEPRTDEYDAADLSVTITNSGPEPLALGPVTIAASLDLAVASALGWTFGGEASGILRLDDLSDGSHRVSRGVLVIEAPIRSVPVLLAGFAALDRFQTSFELAVADGGDTLAALRITIDGEGLVLGAGETVELPALRLAQGTDATELLDEWGHAVEEAMGAATPVLGAALWRAPVGVDLPTLAGSINRLVEAGYDLSTVIIPVEVPAGGSLPDEATGLVEMVHDSGLQACLSVTPLLAATDSPLLEDPENALRSPGGEPITVATGVGDRTVLDATRPAVSAWLRDLATQVLALDVAEIEIAGLNLAVVPAGETVYALAGTTGLGHVRHALAAIHSVAMPNLDVLTSGAPAAAIGLADLVVVDPAAGALLSEAVFLNTAKATPALTIPLDALPAALRRAAAVAAVSACGVVLTGDPSATAPDSAEILRSVIPPAGTAGALDSGDPPDLEAWRAPVDDTFAVVAIFNNGESAQWLAVNEFVDPGEVAFDPWAAQLLDRGDVLLQPGDAAVWQVSSPSADPQVIGDTGHVARERLNLRVVSGRLHVENEDMRSRILAVDVRGRKHLVELEPGEKRWFD